jgi:hypothetical protein
VNFQTTVLKIPVSYPVGFTDAGAQARHGHLATSGRNSAERTKKLTACVSNLNIFSQKRLK